MNDKLKPCPFCGSNARMIIRQEDGKISGDHGYTAEVECKNRECRARIVFWALRKSWVENRAITVWNRRAE